MTSPAQGLPQPDDSAPADGSADPSNLTSQLRDGLRLVEVVREVEKFVAELGWDQNPRLFALARTAELVQLEPALAEALGAQAQDPDSLTPIEQDTLDASKPLDEVLATTMWPPDVVGAALVLERLMLPPQAETTLPTDDGSLAQLIADHPDRQDVRLAVVVLRDGQRECAIRLRTHDDDASVLLGPNLVPRLADALALLAQPKPFCIAVSDALRAYLEERFDFRAPERTTEEFLLDLQNTARLNDAQKTFLSEFLTRCDLVKFARHEPSEAELRSLHSAALGLIEETAYDVRAAERTSA